MRKVQAGCEVQPLVRLLGQLAPTAAPAIDFIKPLRPAQERTSPEFFDILSRTSPKIMTVAAIMAGLVPILWSTGVGSEVMQRIAVPMIGGMVSSTLLTLLVIPALYALIKGWELRRSFGTEVPA